MQHYTMNLTLKVWRQKNASDKGHFETYPVKNISSEMSFLEMIDVLNEQLIKEGQEPLRSITIAAKVSAVCALCISTADHTVLGNTIPLVSYTCVLTKMVIPLWWNPGGPMLFRSLKT